MGPTTNTQSHVKCTYMIGRKHSHVVLLDHARISHLVVRMSPVIGSINMISWNARGVYARSADVVVGRPAAMQEGDEGFNVELDEFSLHVFNFKFMSIGCGNGVIVVCMRVMQNFCTDVGCWRLEDEYRYLYVRFIQILYTLT